MSYTYNSYNIQLLQCQWFWYRNKFHPVFISHTNENLKKFYTTCYVYETNKENRVRTLLLPTFFVFRLLLDLGLRASIFINKC